MWPNPHFPAADLATFIEEILNGKLHFCAVINVLNVIKVNSGCRYDTFNVGFKHAIGGKIEFKLNEKLAQWHQGKQSNFRKVIKHGISPVTLLSYPKQWKLVISS